MKSKARAKGTVQQVVWDLMRSLNMTTVFGNPGSTELNFLTNWPEDFRYVLGLQEASVLGMADGYAQATGTAAFVNLHSAAGLGNALGNVFTAKRNHTPLVITAGQQARDILPFAPYLSAERAAEFPQPYVKWSIEPARAEDIPLALAQAYEIAMQHPRGPTFVSIPAEDWGTETTFPRHARTVPGMVPNPQAIAELANAMKQSRNLALVVGASVDRDGAFDLAVELAERSGATVWEAPTSSRASFPQDHPRFAGFLSAIPESLSESLKPYDLIVVIGAPVFTFHVPGIVPMFDSGVPIYQITDDPAEAAHASAAISMIGTMKLSIEALLACLPREKKKSPAKPARKSPEAALGATPIPIDFAIQAISHAMSDDSILVEEAPSHRPAIQKNLPIRQANRFYTMSSGGLGYSLPASVGVALATGQRTTCIIGDGSSMYSIQSIWTAVQHRLPVTIIVLNNQGYGAMRAFSKILNSTAIPGIELPGIDFLKIAEGLGCKARRVVAHTDLVSALEEAHHTEGPYLLEVAIDPNTGSVY